jgi:putative acetyltransferase
MENCGELRADENPMVDPKNIREMNLETDLDRVCEIWLNEAKHAHRGFICKGFWESRIYSFIAETTEAKERYVWEEEGLVLGFITGVRKSDNRAYIFELYVDYQYQGKKYQGKTVAEMLLDTLKDKYSQLTSHVYEHNTRSLAFQKKCDFRVSGETKCPHTGLPKAKMTWEKT